MSRALLYIQRKVTTAISAASITSGFNLQVAEIHQNKFPVKLSRGHSPLLRPESFSDGPLCDSGLLYSLERLRHHKSHEKAHANTYRGSSFGSVILGLGIAVLWSYKDVECEEQISPVDDSQNNPKTLKEAINEARDLVQRIKDEVGSPGLIIAVSVNGTEVWSEGLGYANVENRVPCDANTVMRIASISKSMTMTIAGRLMEEGKLDIDKNVKHYVKEWPDKEYNGQKVELTTRQLVSHKAGIRHYSKTCDEPKEENNDDKKKDQKKKDEKKKAEFDLKEYYLKRKFPSVSASLKLFKDDPLCFKPGSGFLYTSHGWTLISAVLEGASGKKFPDLAGQLFSDLGLSATYLDENIPIIYNRACNYVKNDQGRLENAPYVDNSYKWAGGGLLSTAKDLCRFGDAMLYSMQCPGGYLKPETMRKIWKPVDDAPCGWDKDGKYAMGWCSIPNQKSQGPGKNVRQYMSHTGGAIGASSVLLVMPSQKSHSPGEQTTWPQGVTVAIAVNMQGVGLNKLALQIAKIFEKTLD